MKHTLIILSILLVLLTSDSTFSQQIATTEDEPIRINTTLAQINLDLDFNQLPEKLEVIHNRKPIPSDQIHWTKGKLIISIIFALNGTDKNVVKRAKDKIAYHLNTLEKTTKGEIVSVNILRDNNKLYEGLKIPKTLEGKIKQFSNMEATVSASIDSLKNEGERRALLIVTDNPNELPRDIIKQTDKRLGRFASLIYFLSINDRIKKLKGKTDGGNSEIRVAASNIVAGDILLNRDDQVGGLFRAFAIYATNLITVSYLLPEESISEENSFKAEVWAKKKNAQGDFMTIGYNVRDIKTEILAESSRKIELITKKTPVAQAIEFFENTNLENLFGKRRNFTHSEIDQFLIQLKNLPEIADLPRDEEKEIAVLKSIKDVLKIFNRDNYTRILVYKSKNPFIGLGNESIIAISTTALKLFNKEEIKLLVAHELAHEFFFDEFRLADSLENKEEANLIRHKVEHLCDLTAVFFLKKLGQKNAESLLVTALEKQKLWYQWNNVTLEEDAYPNIKDRKDCLKTVFEAKRYK